MLKPIGQQVVSLTGRFHARALRCAVLFVLLLMTACGGSLYKVKPVVETKMAAGASGAEAGGVGVRAVPLLTDEESQELFEANLPLAGVLPVRVEINNGGGAPVDFKKVRFRLRDAAGREWKYRAPKQAVKRIMDYYAVYLYNPNARRTFEENFSAHALDMSVPLAAGESRRGLIFFQTPKKEPVAGTPGLVLSIEKLAQPLELRLN